MSNFGQPPESPVAGMAAKPHRGPLLIGLAIAGWVACAFCTPVAFFMARSDRKQILAGEMDPQGAGFTNAAYYVSMIHMVLLVLGICGGIALGIGGALFAPEPAAPVYDTTGY